MSSGKFLINIHFANIYHFLLNLIITQNAQSNYYYVKCFHSMTCSRHLNLTDFEMGASCSIALQSKAKTDRSDHIFVFTTKYSIVI